MAETVAAVGTVTEIVTVDQGAGKYWENHLGKLSYWGNTHILLGANQLPMIKQPQICVSEKREKWIQLQYGNLVWGKYRDRVINHQIVGKARFSDKAGECTSLDDLEVPPWIGHLLFEYETARPLVGANHLTYKILVSSRIIG